MNQDWSQANSQTYRQLAQIAVPFRVEQIAALLTLIPFDPADTFRVVELASGEGYLAHAITQAFPNANILALDYEQSMRDITQKRLGSRAQVAPFDIRHTDWFAMLDASDLVISSLCIHHLDAEQKRRLFQSVHQRLTERGAFLIADLVAPQIPQANRLFAATWDQAAENAARTSTGTDHLFKMFQSEQWNLFHHPDPDFDKPSPLSHQLQWLSESGFSLVDCFWMQAGHAIYGGYRQPSERGISYEQANHIASVVLRA